MKSNYKYCVHGVPLSERCVRCSYTVGKKRRLLHVPFTTTDSHEKTTTVQLDEDGNVMLIARIKKAARRERTAS